MLNLSQCQIVFNIVKALSWLSVIWLCVDVWWDCRLGFEKLHLKKQQNNFSSLRNRFEIRTIDLTTRDIRRTRSFSCNLRFLDTSAQGKVRLFNKSRPMTNFGSRQRHNRRDTKWKRYSAQKEWSQSDRLSRVTRSHSVRDWRWQRPHVIQATINQRNRRMWVPYFRALIFTNVGNAVGVARLNANKQNVVC